MQGLLKYFPGPHPFSNNFEGLAIFWGVSLSIFKDLSSPLYADDCQLYVSAPVDEASATVSRLSHCVTDVASNKQQVEKINTREVAIHLSVITTVDSARDFGVTLHSHLNMSAHVSSMCRSAYHFLRQLRPVVRLLTDDAAKNGSSRVYIDTPGLL